MTDGADQIRRRLRGLLVDDEKLFSMDASSLIEDRLRRRDIPIEMKQFVTPGDAIEEIASTAETAPYDLVMTDMLFPPAGRPDAPPADHVQRGMDVIDAARAAGVPVIIAFTIHGAKRLQEWRTRCKRLGVKLYQRDDLIVAEEDSVIDEIAAMLREFTDLENARKATACVASYTNDRVRRAMEGFLSSVGLNTVDFYQRTSWEIKGSAITVGGLREVFREIQVFIVVLTPELRVIPSDALVQPIGPETPEVRFEPDSRVILAAGMAYAIDPKRVIVVRVGDIRPSNVLYRASIPLDDTPQTQAAVIERLRDLGCRMQGGPIGAKAGFGRALARSAD